MSKLMFYPESEPSENDLDAIEYEDSLGEEAIVNEVRFTIFTGKSHTRCPYGCTIIEAYSTCPHGYDSLAMEWGLLTK